MISGALVRVFVLQSFYFVLVLAQTRVNGQLFSRGLAIINAPAPNSEHTAGGILPISIEVSGNGRIPFDALIPKSGLLTAYEELNIFLVSSQTGANVTVSTGPRLLTDESGTVRHLNWQIPSCTPAGRYNMTFYELSRLNGQNLFAVTPVVLSIRNPNPAPLDDCDGLLNTLDAQPQADVPAPEPPFLPGGNSPQVTFTDPGERTSSSTAPSGNNRSGMTTVIVGSGSPTDVGEDNIPEPSASTNTATMRMEDLSGFVPINSSQRSSGRTLRFYAVLLLIMRAAVGF
ncbi:hypothetical protein FA15DRAFT_662590 [Coprinopsis marcescibilis]|uniref:Uncharacterized protein n=1 Tax=Coprinopsis marcescibilis TaxID=230819 RepID=A0A5C3LD64_COPMA|nr:hypothetical protein FA15DRAFT_662590 [Coprinopsis marcescibilis]